MEPLNKLIYTKYICRREKQGNVLVLIMKQCEPKQCGDDTAFVPLNVLQISLANFI
jgi:hypothetical protein